jgi:hypothetical protein
MSLDTTTQTNSNGSTPGLIALTILNVLVSAPWLLIAIDVFLYPHANWNSVTEHYSLYFGMLVIVFYCSMVLVWLRTRHARYLFLFSAALLALLMIGDGILATLSWWPGSQGMGNIPFSTWWETSADI